MSFESVGLVRLNGPNFWEMQEVPCDKVDVCTTRWSFFSTKWKTTTEENGVASIWMVILRGPGELTKVSESMKATKVFCAFSNRLQKFGHQLSKPFFLFEWNNKASVTRVFRLFADIFWLKTPSCLHTLFEIFIFCPKIHLWFPEKMSIFWGEKLVKMLWFGAF